MLQSIECIHKWHIIHKDIQPSDFLIDVGAIAYHVFIIDFGSGKNYVNNQRENIYYSDGKTFKCTPRFGSINPPLGVEQTRRDNMEFVRCVFIFLLKGVLLWQNMKARNVEDKFNKIKETIYLPKLKNFERKFLLSLLRIWNIAAK